MTSERTAETPRWIASPREMSLGLMLPMREGSMGGATPSFDDLVEMTTAARDVGFEAVWFADHFTFMDDGEPTGAWEAFTMMAGVASRVDGIQLGSLVSCTGFRNPGVIAKMAEALDEISSGRFILGLGAGWNQPEYAQFGFPFDYRASRFEDAIRIVHPLLRDGAVDYQGRFYQANDAVNRPRGPRPGGPPILIGSNGDRLLGSVARYADAWNSDWQDNLDDIRGLLAKVDAACDAAGRPRDAIVRTGSSVFAMPGSDGSRAKTIGGDAQEMAAWLGELRRLGLRHVVCSLDPRTLQSVAAFGEVIKRFDAMTG